MCGRVILSVIWLIVFVVQHKVSSTACSNDTDCEKQAVKKFAKCCNGSCFERCHSIECQFDSDCPAGMKCCDSGECKTQVTFCSLSSKLAVAIPLSLVSIFALIMCICSHHPCCPVYKANQRRRTGVVFVAKREKN